MRNTPCQRTCFLVLLIVTTSTTFGRTSEADQRAYARLAISESDSISEPAIRKLREAGPSGLAAMRSEFEKEIAVAIADRARHDDPAWQRIVEAMDVVAAQKDSYASGLYWYTDIEQAKAASRSSGKPILSLRLLGRLDAELSCANSRFFRTVLYANANVSKLMRERFVLHWQSVRPVPVVTIDMGDGRKIRRTITGNSIHYVLDPDGRPIDGIPGLYGPAAFCRALESADSIWCATLVKEINPQTSLAQWHQDRATEIQREWTADLRKIGKVSMNEPAQGAAAAEVNDGYVPARVAMNTAMPKYIVERPIVSAIDATANRLASSIDADTWTRIAALHSDDSRLDAGSRAMVRAKLPPDAVAAGRRAATKRLVEDPIVRLVSRFEHSVAEDSVRNEYTMHRQIHEWFASGAPQTKSVDALNERVYAELFLTPSSDPWLGLVPPDAYSALENGGVSSR